MRYETVEVLSDEEFKRYTGVQRSTFEKMQMVVEEGLRNFGRSLCDYNDETTPTHNLEYKAEEKMRWLQSKSG